MSFIPPILTDVDVVDVVVDVDVVDLFVGTGILEILFKNISFLQAIIRSDCVEGWTFFILIFGIIVYN